MTYGNSPLIVVAGEEDEVPALAREIVAAIDRLTAAIERQTKVIDAAAQSAHDDAYLARQ
jgi:hypothetical protein